MAESMLVPSTTYDVIVVGCGPVGAMAANLLVAAGLSVLVIERDPEIHPLPRAVHLDHEMMRLFQTAGVVDRMLPLMRETDGHLHIGADHGVIRYMGTVGKPRPYGWANDYFFYQPDLEAALRAAFSARDGVTLLSGASFTSAEQDSEGVTMSFQVGGAVASVRSRWMIGCDGARSSVRKSLGIDLEDLGFEEPWLVVDAEVDGPVRFPSLDGVPAEADLQRLSVMMCDPARPSTIVPGPRNLRRWEFMLLPGEDDALMMRQDSVHKLVDPWLKDVPHRIIRASTYRFHGLVAQSWQSGRIFLAGDAAHQTPPFFGQGMCHGFRDIANLAWKMAAIRCDGARAELLDTYQAERDPHVRAVIGAAVAAGRYICLLDPRKARERDADLRNRTEPLDSAADLIPPLSTGVIASSSPGAGERFIQPTIGRRAKLDDAVGGAWRLFVRDASIPGDGDHVTRLDVSRIDDGGQLRGWLDRTQADAVLVRPDHYVFGTAIADATPLMASLRHHLEGVATPTLGQAAANSA